MNFNAVGDDILTSSLVKYGLDERCMAMQMNNCTKLNTNQWFSFKQKDAQWGTTESILDPVLHITCRFHGAEEYNKLSGKCN